MCFQPASMRENDSLLRVFLASALFTRSCGRGP
jgi:hypothetical protein